MTIEYRTAWPYIQKGGFLLSDDVGWNTAFADFAKEIGCEPCGSRSKSGKILKGGSELFENRSAQDMTHDCVPGLAGGQNQGCLAAADVGRYSRIPCQIRA